MNGRVNFPFNQDPKTKDCGYRCMYYVLNPNCTYEKFLDDLKWLQPVKKGIVFSCLVTVLNSLGKIEGKFTVPSEKGLFIIWSGVWSKGHYFVYHDGTVYDSLEKEAYSLSLDKLILKLESDLPKDNFHCFRIKDK